MGAHTPSQEDLRTCRRHLQELADRLSSGVAQLAAEATRPTGAEGAAAPGRETVLASTEGDEEVARGVLASEGHLLDEVRAALARFDAGMFGRCERCGRPIGKARLQAVPYARRCIRCADAENSSPH